MLLSRGNSLALDKGTTEDTFGKLCKERVVGISRDLGKLNVEFEETNNMLKLLRSLVGDSVSFMLCVSLAVIIETTWLQDVSSKNFGILYIRANRIGKGTKNDLNAKS